MTRPAWALRRFLRDKIVDRLTAEKVDDKRTIDNLANRLQAESLRSGEWAAEMLARVEKLTAELAKVDAAYDEIGDRLVRAEAKLAGRDAWIRRATKALHFIVYQEVLPNDDVLADLLDTAPLVGEAPVKPVSEKYR